MADSDSEYPELWEYIKDFTNDILNHKKCYTILQIEFYDAIRNIIKDKNNGIRK